MGDYWTMKQTLQRVAKRRLVGHPCLTYGCEGTLEKTEAGYNCPQCGRQA